ncbi:MAG TPA: pitrilysin family protein [Acidimicrobiia bacterium]|nr:pitrilysin family protein [Acidimicrobiia bacterium]
MSTLRDPSDGIRHTALDDGLRVVTEAMPELRSAAVGFWVGTGSRDEPESLAGASHFLEHVLFKGSDERSARAIAEAVESVGGDMNAFTTQEYTAFYVRVPDDHLPLALDILSDIIWTPALRADEIESERQVILEEIRMRDDTPDDVVHEQFGQALFPRHALGREVLGTVPSIEAMARDDIAAYHRAHYRPGNVVVAAAGNVVHEDVVRMVEKWLPRDAGARPERVTGGLVAPEPLVVTRRGSEQAHIVLGMRALSRDDADRYGLAVLNQALGGGMSSRLFQEIREKRGLAYSVFSYRSGFEETGLFAVYAGTAPTRAHETLQVLRDELDRVANHGLDDAEIEAAKGHLKGSMALSLESSASRMHRLGRNQLVLGSVPTLDELVADVDAVTPDDVARVVGRVLVDEPRTLAVVGPFDESDLV